MPDSVRRSRSTYVLYGLLLVLLAISMRYHAGVTGSRFEEVAHGQDIVRDPFDVDLPGMTVDVRERPEAQAAGIRAGDRIEVVQGRPVRGSDDVYPPLLDRRPGDQFLVGMARADGANWRPYTATIRLKPMREGAATRGDWLVFAIVDVAFPYLCMALGFWVVAVRIRDRLAWILLLVLLSLAEFGGASWRVLYGNLDWFHPVSAIYQPVLANLWPLSMMLFGLYFPHRLPLDQRYPWVKWLIIGPVLFRVFGTNVPTDILTLRHASTAVRIEQTFLWMRPIVTALHLVSISVFFAALGYHAVVEKQPDARRRLRLLYVGALIAVVPLLIVFILAVSGIAELPDSAVPVMLSILFIFPLTMAYVVVVERALDVRLVIRQGVRYVLARGSIRLLQLLGSIGIFYVAIERWRELTSADRALTFLPILVGVIAIVLIGRFSERLGRWVDRRFFREAYNTEQILAELATQVRTIVETQPLLETVSRQISSALHVPRLAILLNSGGVLQPAYALGYADVRTVPVPEDSTAIAHDVDLRTALDAELVLPLSANKKLVGVMGLGPKQSEEPFTHSDVRLLDAVATQTGLALENSRLTAEIAAEVAEREKRKREMEIASEVQQRLFPQAYPDVAGLEMAGACRPALAVGGDYYDFVELPGGRLAIAIGDISGKGFPAALLMATLRAYLRSQTIQAQENLAGMIANLNALVYESSAANRYATFFYAQYDPSTRLLDYVNAGHNPPMVFRCNRERSEVIRLETGGPVIGLLPECGYEQGRITLQAGDVFVSFTDGVSEAMNGEMEEWGEERLIETVLPARSRALSDLITVIMAGADAHTGTAPQHDDMTLVLARCV